MCSPGSGRFICFGSFQLDLRAGELRRNGIKVRLPDQSIKVLALLVENPGEVVTREELQRRLWPNGTIVEFDRSINASIKRLREALEDSAEAPRFIETLPRRGYRFLLSVEREASGEEVRLSEPGPDSETPPIKSVSHYRIVRKLGQGAMGVVYEAEDTRLGRSVALKFLPEELVNDPQALGRFGREARAASALNHPNICTLYDIGEMDGRPFLAMERLEGETLAERIAGKPIRTDQLLDLSIQIADALEVAHSKGIIHRDVKPANIFITTRGQAKIMDFGLAKLAKNRMSSGANSADSEMPTSVMSEQLVTNPYAALGTVAYMSPEQARGEGLDTRTDLFSFGVALYEMATGQRPFQGDTSAVVFHAILSQVPTSPVQLRPDVPAALEHIIYKSLEKDRKLRYQSAAEMRTDLHRLKRDTDSRRALAALPDRWPATAPAHSRYGWRWVAALATVVAMILGAAGVLWFSHPRAATPEAAFNVVPLTTYLGVQSWPTFSPDGSQVAFSWNGEKQGNSNIYVKVIGFEAPLRLTTTPADEYSPAWSPDGRWIAFCRTLPGGKYAVVLTSPIPGPERIITERYGDPHIISGPYLSWSPDSQWLAIAGADGPGVQQTLFLYSLETGEKRRITSRPIGDWQGDSCPAFSADGRKLAFSRWTAWAMSELYLLDLSPDLKPVAEPKRVTAGNWEAASPAWTANGNSLIFSTYSGTESSLWRVEVSGPSKPQRLTGLGDTTILPATARRGNRLAYARFTSHDSIWRMAIPPPGGKTKPPEKFIFSTRNDSAPEISPDGRKVAFWSDRSGSGEIWMCDPDGSNLVQLTSWNKFINSRIFWSPDSRRLAFGANVEGHSEVYVLNISGGSPQRRTFTTYAANPSWSNDGHWIFFDSTLNNRGIYKVPADGGPTVPVRAPGWAPRESPDGKFMYGIDGSDDDGLVRAPAGGGKEELVLSLNFAFGFALVEGGIYFIPKPDRESGYSIQYLNTANGRVHRIASVGTEPFYPTVSPDQRWMLYFQHAAGPTNLMLVENFH